MKNKINPPSNSIFFIIIQRVIGFPFFFGITLSGAIILVVKWMANYVVYGGEAISYTEKTRRKTINDIFDKLVEQQNK